MAADQCLNVDTGRLASSGHRRRQRVAKCVRANAREILPAIGEELQPCGVSRLEGTVRIGGAAGLRRLENPNADAAPPECGGDAARHRRLANAGVCAGNEETFETQAAKTLAVGHVYQDGSSERSTALPATSVDECPDGPGYHAPQEDADQGPGGEAKERNVLRVFGSEIINAREPDRLFVGRLHHRTSQRRRIRASDMPGILR